MIPIPDLLEKRICDAIRQVTGQDYPALIRIASDAKFGDYQANGIMAAAKQAKTNPRKLAEQIVEVLKIDDICQEPEIAGPGFINLRLKDEFLAGRLLELNVDAERLGIEKSDEPKRIVVDYSAPNIAKQMHVGHLRSTIIGDCICRMLEFEGHTVIRQNHIGDWGTPMGMVIFGLAWAGVYQIVIPDNKALSWSEILTEINNGRVKLTDLEDAYKRMVTIEKDHPDIASNIRKITSKLQKHDPELKRIWEAACKITLKECLDIYGTLNINLSMDDVRGESFYADKLAEVVSLLKDKSIATESDGAICVFPEGFTNKEGDPLPFIIQKSDGAFLYATTDCAAIRYRVNELKAEKIIYVTDDGQALHFKMLFATAKLAGWLHDNISAEHVTFGKVLGEDGKRLKTRSGDTVKLKDLLDEAVERAGVVVNEKNPDLSVEQKQEIAKAVGIGAVKYADYSNNRDSDYIFSFDKMLAMEGNTAPYMQYAYARVRSIERKAAKKEMDIESELAGIETINFTENAEKDLAKCLLRYDQAIHTAASLCRPNYLTGYLYDLSQAFSRFYNACPVLQADADQRPTRLLLCDLTARTIYHGMHSLLGIEMPEQM